MVYNRFLGQWRPAYVRTCRGCHVEFLSTAPNRAYCGTTCGKGAKGTIDVLIQETCIACGQPVREVMTIPNRSRFVSHVRCKECL